MRIIPRRSARRELFEARQRGGGRSPQNAGLLERALL